MAKDRISIATGFLAAWSRSHGFKKDGAVIKLGLLLTATVLVVVAQHRSFRHSFPGKKLKRPGLVPEAQMKTNIPRELNVFNNKLRQYALPALQKGSVINSNSPSSLAGGNGDYNQEHYVYCRLVSPDADDERVGSPTDVVVEQYLSFEDNEEQLVEEVVLALENAGPDSVLIDVGAGSGNYSIAAAVKGHDAIAFEPRERKWRRICNSTNDEDPSLRLDTKVSLYNAVVVEEFGDSNSLRGGVVRDGGEATKSSSMSEKTGTTWKVTLDSMMAQGVLPLDRPVAMKLSDIGGDGTGRELCEALGGGLKYLREADLIHVQMKVTSDDSFFREEDCPKTQEVIDALVQRRLTPTLHRSTGGPPEVLDPKKWRRWFEDEPTFIAGDILWNERETEYLTFGASITWGTGLARREDAYPFLLSPNVTNLAMHSTGAVYPSLCTSSLVGEHDGTPYDVVVLEYHLPIDGLAVLARRVRQRFPDAILIFIQYWYPYQVYHIDASTGGMESASAWTERLGHGELHDASFKEAMLHSLDVDWQWADVTDINKVQSDVVREVGGHLLSMPKPSNPRMFVDYANWYCPDWLHLSEKGHEFLAKGIQHMVDSVGIASRPRLGSWGDGDSCHSWFHGGDCPLERSSNVELEVLNVPLERHFLRFPREGSGTVTVENPSNETLELRLGYMVTGPPPSKYPKTKVMIDGDPSSAVVLDPVPTPEYMDAPVHVSVMSPVGMMIGPGRHDLSFLSLEKTEYPFRLISTVVSSGSETETDFGPFFRGDSVISRTSNV